MIVSGFEWRWRLFAAHGDSRRTGWCRIEFAAVHILSFNGAKTVSPPDNAIVEIISPFAFTFKIPFH